MRHGHVFQPNVCRAVQALLPCSCACALQVADWLGDQVTVIAALVRIADIIHNADLDPDNVMSLIESKDDIRALVAAADAEEAARHDASHW